MNIQKFFIFMIVMVAAMIGHRVEAEFCERGSKNNCWDGTEPTCCTENLCCDFENNLCVECPQDPIGDQNF